MTQRLTSLQENLLFNKNEMGENVAHMVRGEVKTRYWWGNLWERDHL